MADLKISQLPAATTPVAGTEVLPIVQSGTTSKVSIADLTAGRAISALSVNKVTVTEPASAATLTIADGKTFAVNNTLTMAGTDATTMTFPSTSTTVVGTNVAQTLSAKTLTNPLFTTVRETATISATAATGTVNFDAITQSVLYYTSNASGNWTLNVRGDSGTSLDSIMSTGQSLTIAFLVTNGGTAYYQTALNIDGSAVTPKWQAGSAPSSGNINSIDIYSITIVKTGSATFTVFEGQTQFA
jgi:hypothetical protein